MERLPKLASKTAGLAALIAATLAASAPTRADHQLTPFSASVSAVSNSTPKQSAKHSVPFQVGKASWYGEAFDGKPTASGEPFDMYELTAAHRTLPLGSWVKVTNLRNHRWVLVRINDRGPVPQQRIIDLSYSAARVLNMSGQGIARVRLDLVKTSGQSSLVAMLNSPR